MRTIADIKAELKAKGIKGITGKKKAELEAMLEKHKSGGEKSPKSPKEACSCHDKKPKKPKMPKMPYVAKLAKDSKTGKLMKIPKSPEIDKKISTPKKLSVSLQEKLAKAGLRGGNKMKYNV